MPAPSSALRRASSAPIEPAPPVTTTRRPDHIGLKGALRDFDEWSQEQVFVDHLLKASGLGEVGGVRNVDPYRADPRRRKRPIKGSTSDVRLSTSGAKRIR